MEEQELPSSFKQEDNYSPSNLPSSFKPEGEKEGFFSKAGKFLDEHPKLKGMFTGSTPELEEAYKKAGISGESGQGLSEIPGIRHISEAIRQKGRESGDYWKGFGSSIAGDILDLLGSGVDPRAVVAGHEGSPPIKNAITDESRLLGPSRTYVSPKGAAYSGELPIRASSEIPFRAGEPTALETTPKAQQAIQDLPLRQARGIPTDRPDLAPVGSEDIFNIANRGMTKTSEISEDEAYNLAKKKFNMGEEIPEAELPKSFSPEEKKPTATFKGMQEDGKGGKFPLFDVEGGKLDKSTVSEESLKKEGIEVPPVEEAPKKGFVNPFEKSKLPESFSPEGVIGPAKDLKPGELINAVNNGKKPSAILENVDKDDLEQVISTAKKNGLHITENPIEKTEPIISKDAETGAKLAESLNNGDHETTGKLLGYSDADISAFKKNLEENPIPPKKEYTIENAPPNQRARMFRGANEPVDVLFKDPESREMFGAGQRPFKKGEFQPNIYQRLNNSAERISQKYNIEKQEAQKLIVDYNAEVRDLGKKVDKEGGNLTAPTFSDFLKDKAPKSLVERLKGEAGVLNIERDESGKFKFQGPTGPALEKLFNSLENARTNITEQETLNKAERAKRIFEFSNVKDTGVKGASQQLSKLRGSFEKVDTFEGDELKLNKREADSLFTAVKTANITPFEKARGYTALFKLLNGDTPVRSELNVLDDVFGRGFSSKIIEMQGGIGPIGLKLTKAANTMKAFENIGIGAPLIHGTALIHRPEWRNAVVEMFKYITKPEYFDAAMKNIEERPFNSLGRDSGLFLAKTNSMTKGEEDFMRNYIGNIPKMTGIPMLAKSSERGYVGFLNRLRADTFDNLIKQAKNAGLEPYDIITTEEGKELQPNQIAKNLAKYVNVATDRGNLGKLEKMAPELNTLLWSPRRIAARYQLLKMPLDYMKSDSFTRNEAIKSLFSKAAIGSTIATLGYLAGGRVNLSDTTSSDFGKVRFGNNVLNPWGPEQSMLTASSRVLKYIASGGSGGAKTPIDIASQYLVNHLAPATSLGHEVGTAKKWIKSSPGEFIDEYGKKQYLPAEIRNKFLPIFAQDMKNVFQNDTDFTTSLGLDAAAIAGQEVQNYPPPKGRGSLRLGTRRLAP